MALVKQQIREINPFCEKNKELNRSTSRKRKRLTPNQKLTLYLDEDSSIENAAVQTLQSRIKRTKIENAKPRIQQHMEGTRGQQDKSKQLISNLGGKRSATKDKATITNSNSYSS
jgi:Domain of unknown function (DUF892)